MTLTNYWVILIWFFIGAFLFGNFFPKKKVLAYGRVEYRWTISAAFLLFLPYVIWAGCRSNSFGDTIAYKNMFKEAPSVLSQALPYAIEQTKDKGFFFITVIFKSLIGESSTAFFLLIAFIQGICLVYVYRKYSCNYAMSIFLLLASTDYVAWMHNGIRQFIVVAISFACFPLIQKKKYFSVIFILVIASTIHAMALIVIPFIFISQGKAWNKKSLLFLIGVVLSIIFLDQFTNIVTTTMENTQYSAGVGDFLSDTGVNIYRVIVYSVPTIISLIFKRRLDRYQNRMINFCINMSIVSSGLYIIGYFTSGIMFGRLPIFFSLYNYILLPWEIQNLFTRESAKIITVVCCGLYLFFFYYQMHFAWGLI